MFAPPTDDPHFQASERWARDFLTAVHEGRDETALLDGPAFLRSQQQYLAFAQRRREGLLERLWQLSQQSAALAALAVTGVVGLGLDPTWPLRLAFVCFVLATFATALGRFATWSAAPSDAPRAIEGFKGVRRIEIAEAVAAYLQAQAIHCGSTLLMRALDAATGCFCLGLLMLLGLLF